MTPDRAEQLARQAQEPGVQAVRELAQVRLALAEALQRDAVAYQEAAKHYPPDVLKRFGFPPPAKRVQGRPASGGRAPRTRQVDVPAGDVPDRVRSGAGSQGEGLSVAG